MFSNLFYYVIETLKDFAPISITINVVLGILLVVAAIVLLKQKNRTRGLKIGGYTCMTIGVLGFTGAVANWFVSYIIY